MFSTVKRILRSALPCFLVDEMGPYSLRQPPPRESTHPAVWDLVVRDMVDRNAMGTSHYGTPLRAFNGRDALKDAYSEALDQCVYLRQALYERDGC